MKKQLMRFMHTSSATKFFKAATVAVVILAGAAHVNAQALNVSAPAISANAAPNVVVSHLSTTGETSLFEVKVDNTAGERFRVVIKSAEGTTLFQETYSDKNFDKTFRIPKSESDALQFVIKGLSGNSVQTFVVNSESHYVEDVVVRKVI